MSTAYSTRVRWSPSFTASVRLPDTVSPGMSRRLFTTSSAVAKHPTITAQPNETHVISPSWTYVDPVVATRPKNTNTNASPRPRYPYGLGPPV